MTAILDIDLLRTFHTVVRLGKFSAAAEQLHKSPAAVSVHIQRLEAVAGGRLLNRDNQSVSLTELGKRLLASTVELLRRHDQALADLHGTDLVGHIKLGVPDEYAAHVIRDLLPTFMATWPHVVLELQTGPSHALKEQVRRGKLQCAVVAQAKGEAGGDAERLVSTTPVWVGPRNATLNLSDPLPLAVHALQCPYREAMMKALEASGRPSRIVLESHSNQAVKACVEAGLAISLIDRAKVTERMQILQELPPVSDHDILLMRSLESKHDEIVELLAQVLRQSFRL